MSTYHPSRPTWLITGTSNGLGLSLSQHILLKGHNLISLSRHASPHASLTSLHQTSKEPAATFDHIHLDLSNPDPNTIKSTISTFLQSHPKLSVDILVNNAAITLFDPVEHTSPSTLNTVMTTNFFSPVYLTQSLLPQMRNPRSSDEPNGHPKIIVNVSSTQGLCTDPSELSYDASKHALEAMSGVLASEVANFGIRVMVIELGSLRTAFASAGEAKRQTQTPSIDQNAQKQQQTQEIERNEANPYTDPSHPVAKRKAGVAKLASEPGLARGDPMKTAQILFDAVMKTEGTVVNDVLERQRRRTREDGGNVKVERLVLGSDAQPKIEKAVERLRFDVESCRGVSSLIEADEGGEGNQVTR